MKKGWFEVDKEGLAALIGRRSPGHAILELIANAWDEDGVRNVHVNMTPRPHSPYAEVTVTDDSRDGWADLEEARRLFAPSKKRSESRLRGRFNFGEKAFASLCRELTIRTTSGTALFTEDGGYTVRRSAGWTRPRGTEVYGVMRMTRDEMRKAELLFENCMSPDHIATTWSVDGGEREIFPSYSTSCVAEIGARLATVTGGKGDAPLRRTYRQTTVGIYKLGAPALVLEMGIPICEIEGEFTYNVCQKVPMGLERESVTPAYLAQLRGATVEKAHEILTEADASEAWVADALEIVEDPDALNAVMNKRFGEKRVSFDMSDREANNRAASKGYAVIHGGSFSKRAWDNLRTAGAIKPAGKVVPTPHPQFSPDGKDIRVPESQYQLGAAGFLNAVEHLANQLTGYQIRTEIVNSSQRFAAMYGSRTISFNVRRLGWRWFEGEETSNGRRLTVVQLHLFLHELAHSIEGNHLSDTFHDAICDFGARLALLLAEHPEWAVYEGNES